MKKAAIVFSLCLALVLVCAVSWALPVYRSREQVEITAQTLSGDPAAAQGLTIHQKAHYGWHVLWDTAIPAHAPQETTAEVSYVAGDSFQMAEHFPPEDGEVLLDVPHLTYTTINHHGLSNDDFFSRFREDEQPYVPIFRDVASRAPNGESYFETISLADYMDHYPVYLSVYGDFSETDYRWTADETSAQRIFQDFFQFPCDPALTFDFIVWKDSNGTVQEVGINQAGIPLNLDIPSAFTDTACYFTFGAETNLDLDFSQVPGGLGIYRMDLTTESDEVITPSTTTFLYVEAKSLTNACPLPEGAVVLDLSLSDDGQSLFAVCAVGEDYTLLILDPETSAVRQTLPLPAQPPEPITVTYYTGHEEEVSLETLAWDGEGSLQGEDFYLFFGDHTFHFFLQGEDGTYHRALSGLTHGMLPQAAAWNGESLALTGRGDDSHLDMDLSVWDRGGLRYLAQYKTSLASDVGVRLAWNDGLTLTWD